MPCQHASGPIQWSIIVPSHNAAARILAYLQNITSYMQNRGKPYKILVVDDGSTDATASIVKTMATTVSEIQLLRAPLHRDKGAAVRRGMQSAIGRLQLFTYADGATPVQELARLEQAVANGADVAIGSRSLASRLPDYAVHARWYRTIVSNLFNSLIQQKGLGGTTDTQCGFKFFHHTVAADLFGVSSIVRLWLRPRTALMWRNNADTASQKFRWIGPVNQPQNFASSETGSPCCGN
jgi:dolichyl-phosphate beta-glucosyltransferase